MWIPRTAAFFAVRVSVHHHRRDRRKDRQMPNGQADWARSRLVLRSLLVFSWPGLWEPGPVRHQVGRRPRRKELTGPGPTVRLTVLPPCWTTYAPPVPPPP